MEPKPEPEPAPESEPEPEPEQEQAAGPSAAERAPDPRDEDTSGPSPDLDDLSVLASDIRSELEQEISRSSFSARRGSGGTPQGERPEGGWTMPPAPFTTRDTSFVGSRSAPRRPRPDEERGDEPRRDEASEPPSRRPGRTAPPVRRDDAGSEEEER